MVGRIERRVVDRRAIERDTTRFDRDRPAHPDVVEAAGIAVGIDARRLNARRPRHLGLGAIGLEMRGPKVGLDHQPIGVLDWFGVEVADDDRGPGLSIVRGTRREPFGERGRLARPDRLVRAYVVQVGHDEVEALAARGRQRGPQRAAAMAEVKALRRLGTQPLPHQRRVAVLRSCCPAAMRDVAPRPGRPEDPILLDREHALLEAHDVRLESGHVGEQERQALAPPVGDVPDVQGRNGQARQRLLG